MFEPVLHNKPVLIQGITGRHGAFHTAAMLAAGTHIVAGVTPGKAGESVVGVPVYNSVREALLIHPCAASIVFVPAAHAKTAMLEALRAGIQLVVCITEGVPVHDTLEVLAKAKQCGAVVVGPNCPGLLVPGGAQFGIIPYAVGLPGTTAIVSRSGTLTYEVAAELTAAGIGQRIIVGIGGDLLGGLTFTDCLRAFEADGGVERIVLIGEIGGHAEQAAAAFIAQNITKPVFAYVVGWAAPSQLQLGHAGAIMGGAKEGAAVKTAALAGVGAVTAQSIPELIATMKASINSV